MTKKLSSWLRKLIIDKMSKFLKLASRFTAIPIKISADSLQKLELTLKLICNNKGNFKNPNNFENEEQGWRSYNTGFQDIL